MPTKFRRLKEEAIIVCNYRNHVMGNFRRHDYYKDTKAYAYCTFCSMQVIVNSHPQPNEIDIGGEAVALYCSNYTNSIRA